MHLFVLPFPWFPNKNPCRALKHISPIPSAFAESLIHIHQHKSKRGGKTRRRSHFSHKLKAATPSSTSFWSPRFKSTFHFRSTYIPRCAGVCEVQHSNLTYFAFANYVEFLDKHSRGSIMDSAAGPLHTQAPANIEGKMKPSKTPQMADLMIAVQSKDDGQTRLKTMVAVCQTLTREI